MPNPITFAFLSVSIISPLVPIVVGWRRRFSLLWMYALTGLVFEGVILLLKRVLEVNHHWATNLFFLSEFVIVSFLYKERIFRRRLPFILFVSSLSLYFVYGTIQIRFKDIFGLGVSLFHLAILFYAVKSFYEMLQELNIPLLSKSRFFWMNIAFLFYAAGNFFLFLFKDELRASENELFILLWSSCFLILNIMKNLFIALALRNKMKS